MRPLSMVTMRVCSIVAAIADAVGPMLPMRTFVIAYVSIPSHMDLVHPDDDTKHVCVAHLYFVTHVCTHCTHNCRNDVESNQTKKETNASLDGNWETNSAINAYRTFWCVSRWTRKLYWLLNCLWQMKQVAYNLELAGFGVRHAAAAAAAAAATIGWSGVVGSDVCECDGFEFAFGPDPAAVIKSIGVFMSSIDGVALKRCCKLPNVGAVFIIMGDVAGEFWPINCLLTSL